MSKHFASLACFFVISACGVQDAPALQRRATVQSALGQAISSIAPTSGTRTTAVVLTGTGFTGTTSLYFNGRPSAFTVNSDTQISTTVPAGATGTRGRRIARCVLHTAGPADEGVHRDPSCE